MLRASVQPVRAADQDSRPRLALVVAAVTLESAASNWFAAASRVQSKVVSVGLSLREGQSGHLVWWFPSKLLAMSDINNESITAIEATLNDVDRALERLRVGTYRSCQVCNAPIGEAELIANPLLANCPAHPELA